MKKFISLFLAFVIAFGAPLPSYAGFAQLKPPAGWSKGGSGSSPGPGGSFRFGAGGAAANEAQFLAQTVRTNATLNVGGKLVTMPVDMRFAANAAQVAATFAFGNPWIWGTLAVGSAAYNWFKDAGLKVDNGIWVKTDPNVCSVAPCYEFANPITSVYYPTLSNACGSMVGLKFFGFVIASSVANGGTWSQGSGVCSFKYVGSNDAQNTNVPARPRPPGDPAFTPIGDPEFHQKLDPKPIPDAMPKQLPEIDWPVELPIINPDPSIAPQPRPAPETSPRPLWIPSGNPVKNPNPDRNPDGSPKTNPDGSPILNPKPDTWTQPGTRVVPAPTPEDPWQVDVKPEEITKPDPSPNPEHSGDPEPGAVPKPSPAADIITCGLPGTPPCKIDETGTEEDGEKPLEKAKTKIDEAEKTAKEAIEKAAIIEAPSWTFTFQLPTGCAPYATGLRGVILNICQWQSTIHDLMSMVWAGSTFFCIAGMVGRTIRES